MGAGKGCDFVGWGVQGSWARERGLAVGGGGRGSGYMCIIDLDNI